MDNYSASHVDKFYRKYSLRKNLVSIKFLQNEKGRYAYHLKVKKTKEWTEWPSTFEGFPVKIEVISINWKAIEK